MRDTARTASTEYDTNRFPAYAAREAGEVIRVRTALRSSIGWAPSITLYTTLDPVLEVLQCNDRSGVLWKGCWPRNRDHDTLYVTIGQTTWSAFPV